jgi:hypothetical protein
MAIKFQTVTMNRLDTTLNGRHGLLLEGISTLQGRGDAHLNALVNDLVSLRRELSGTADRAKVQALVKSIYQQAGRIQHHEADVQQIAQRLRESIQQAVQQ